MHRFRKKSDAKRAQVPDHLSSSNPRSQHPTLPNQHNSTPDTLPTLPPASDFRTSLILPSLSRRFTLLRDSNGDPVSLNDMRARFAEQRARGAEHQISEEEEDMIVQALGELQSTNVAASQSLIPPTPSNTSPAFSPNADSTFATQQTLPTVHHSTAGDSDYPSSIRSGTASFASSPSSVYPRSIPSSTSRTSISPRYSTKRNSNNLFGSGRFHDTSYLHSISKASVASSRSTTSLTGSDSHGGSVRSQHSTREAETDSKQVLPPDTDSTGEPASTPDRAAPSSSVWPVSLHSTLSALPRLSKEFTLQQARRTSLALEQVIRGIEEEAEETIMVPRTSLSKTGALNSRTQSPKHSETPSTAGTPIPWMTDEARVDDRDEDETAPSVGAQSPVVSVPASPSPGPFPRPGTTSPTPRLPGYIPGMTRPLTPRDADSDDGATGYSTTPRARSPAQSHHSHSSNNNQTLSFIYPRHQPQPSLSSEGQSILPPSILRSSRGSTQMSPLRTTSPGLGNRSRGNSSSTPLAPSPVPSPGPEERLKSDLLSRRPLSPAIGSIVSNGYMSSRPGTPSGNGSWQPSSPLAQMHTAPPTPPNDQDSSQQPDLGYIRSENFVSGTSAHTTDSIHGNISIIPGVGAWTHKQHPNHRNGTISPNGALVVHRDQSVSSFDLGQSSRSSAVAAKIAARSPTPIHTHSRSPVVNDSGNGQDPILLNRPVSKRSQKRMRSPTPPPHNQHHAQTPPLALHTPTSSSNSSSNVNLHLYPNTSQLFSPMLNTSATSLLSAGSSYHSWADENTKKSGWDQLVEYDSQRSAWQDILNSGGAGAHEDTSDTEASRGPEQLLHSITGLTKGDLAAVQKKLVADALSRKSGLDPPRSPTRRRRISNPRGSFSAIPSGRESGTNSPGPPPPQSTSTAENGYMPPSPDSTSRANALLDSVLNSIQSQSATSTTGSTPASSDNPSVEPLSSTDDDTSSKLPSINSSSRESHEDDTSALRYKALADALAETEKPPPVNFMGHDPITSEPIQSPEEDSGEATEVPASHSWRSPPPPVPVPVPASHTVQLVQDITRKATEATAALKNPPQPKIGDHDGTLRRRPTKRIDLQQISSPQLVSSSTSVNALPISPAVSPRTSSPISDPRSPLKLSQRFKKLRGTLRAKPTSRDDEEVTPSVVPTQIDASQSLVHHHSASTPAQTLVVTRRNDSPASATEIGRFRVPAPSPPASAGPGLKGFMARFRKPRKDSIKDRGIRSTGYQSPDSTSPVSPPHERVDSGVPVSSPSSAMPRQSEDFFPMNPSRVRSPTPDPATVNQLFDAASQLGLDRGALDELLARSTSTSSRSTSWAPGATAFVGRRTNTMTKSPAPRTPREDHSLDRSRTPESYKPPARPNAVNRHPDSEIVRRTIIFASDNASTLDLNGLTPKDSALGRQQRSPSAASNHSSASATREPPVPRLPVSLGRTHSIKPSESGSFHDMFSQEQAYPSVQDGSIEEPSLLPSGTIPSTEEQAQGPALEVLHLSNGQVIWSVLDSLRAAADEDSESLFRRSMASSRGNDVSEDMEVRFKEHKRWDSKGSNYSQGSHLSRRRQLVPSGPRPETKLFKTNSSTIGRLIEDLSKNMDSGSFNIMRAATATASSSTSLHSDTSGPSHQVERELEALLNVINPRPAL